MIYLGSRLDQFDGRPFVFDGDGIFDAEKWADFLAEGDLPPEASIPVRPAELVEVRNEDFHPMVELRKLIRVVAAEVNDPEQGSEETLGKIMMHVEQVQEKLSVPC